ncbi:CRISPR-associated protein Csx3 [Crocosphaera sp. XPORK-15E]|uniref:CRISPR-associated protein Csx3 n=1 Tax=Crocosphaera sp. XPORK-15E TaxID=3110247 RepID=UPI002B1EB4E4|nr:CRISPR-associated protein Csx3 [Crocosphaera sp. XPORK-15E]MEA5537324.1 CRISPR-associated protein Csx3 [Crocosphaera sp. XPORK-15E]
MTSYHIELIKDTLNVNFGDTLTPGNVIVAEVEAKLKQLILSKQLSGGALLKIFGPISIPLSYTIAHNLCHLYKVIAVSDTRLNASVVISSTDSNYPVGSRLDLKTGKLQENLITFPEQNESVFIDWEENILNVSLNRQVEIDGDLIVKEVAQKLNLLCANNHLKGGQLLKIKGRATVLVSFVIAQKLAHFYGAIAVYEPKLGTSELEKYIIVISHNPQYHVGETIDEKTDKNSFLKVVLCGSPNTGKTCLRKGLEKALGKLPLVPEFLVISGCPDGDGSWFAETAQKNAYLAEKLKGKYKASFTPEFAHEKARQIKAIKNPLLIFDVGGKISPENEIIMKQANRAVILAKNENEVKEWQMFCQKLNVPVIAIIYSDYEATNDTITVACFPILQGTIHHLERSVDPTNRPMIQELAKLLNSLLLENLQEETKS